MTEREGQGQEALTPLQLVRRYKEWAAHRGDDEALRQWRSVERALKAHDAEVAAAALRDVVSLRRNYQVRAEHWPEPRAQWSDIVADLDRIIGRRGDVIR